MPNRDKNILYGISCAIIGSANRILSAKTSQFHNGWDYSDMIISRSEQGGKRLPQFIDNFIAER